MQLEGVYESYKAKADTINWESFSPNELVFKYIQHEHDDLCEAYLAGIICRYWGLAGRMYTQCKRHIPIEECLDCVIDAIRYVLSKRVWENEKSSLYNDPYAPDKAIHIAIKRQRGIMLARKSAIKRTSDFNTVSIDAAYEDYKDAAEGLLFGCDDEESKEDYLMRPYINSYFVKGSTIEGLILDDICYSSTGHYKPRNIVNDLMKLDENGLQYYSKYYNVNSESYNNALKDISIIGCNKLERRLKSLLYTIGKKEFTNVQD